MYIYIYIYIVIYVCICVYKYTHRLAALCADQPGPVLLGCEGVREWRPRLCGRARGSKIKLTVENIIDLKENQFIIIDLKENQRNGVLTRDVTDGLEDLQI